VLYYPVPVADFAANVTAGAAALTVNFTDSSTGPITNRSWTFGDGATSNLTNPAHTYTNAGVYTVKLTVTGPGGLSQMADNNYITVTNILNSAPPVLTVVSPVNEQVFSSANITVTGTATAASGIEQVTVNGHLATINGSAWSLATTLAVGTNTLTVAATDNSSKHNVTTETIRAILTAGSVATNSTQLQILDGPVVTNAMAQVGSVSVIVAGESVGFGVTAADAYHASLTYAWDFGDGQAGIGSAPVHTYTNAACQGYTVNVMVSDGVNSVTGTVHVATACQLNVTKLQLNSNFVETNADRVTLNATVDAGASFEPAGQVVAMDVGQAQVSFQLDPTGHGQGAYGKCRLAYNKRTGLWNLTASLSHGDWHSLWTEYDMVKGPLAEAAIPVTVPAIVVIGQDAFANQSQMSYSAATEKSGIAH
jgi:PKD repeat protein